MRTHQITRIFGVTVLLALATLVHADSPPPTLRSAITAGGSTLVASSYTLTGAIGQPLAGPVGQADGYALTSGLFGGAGGGDKQMYLPLIISNIPPAQR